MFLLTWVAIDIVSTVLMFYMKYVLDMEAASEIILIISSWPPCFYPSGYGSRKRWVKKLHILREWAYSYLLLVIISLLRPGMATAVHDGSYYWVGLSAAHVIPFSIIPDCIEYDEMKTGENAGAYFGIQSFLRQLISLRWAFHNRTGIEWSGYVADQPQSRMAINALRAL